MKYLVMENRESHSIVMDENGLFHRVANLGYEIGDTVTDPVFMKTPEHKKKTNWKKVSTIAAIFICMLLTAIPLVNSNAESDVVVYMSINPQVHLELNEDGKINKLVADNEDGKILLEGYKYRGKSVAAVLSDLIDRAENLKYLTAGGDIHITVEASDETKAKNVEVDLSHALKENFVEKYMIKIKSNEESFKDLDDVLDNEELASSSETEQMTSESSADSCYSSTEQYTETTETTESSTASTIQQTIENQITATESVENSKPTEKPTVIRGPTEKPTVITRPTEKPIVGTKPSEPTSSF